MSNEALRRFAAGERCEALAGGRSTRNRRYQPFAKDAEGATARRKRRQSSEHSRAFAGGGLMATLEPIAVTEKQKIFEIIREISAEM